MMRRMLSLLLALSLVLGLLPAAAFADSAEPAAAKIAIMKAVAANTVEVTEGGEPVYGKSVAFDGYNSTGVAKGTGWMYTQEGASANDWNFKFEYPQGGVPTLTLKDAKLVQTDAVGNTLYTADGISTGSWTAIAPRTQAIDLKIVLQGENVIRTTNGIIRAAASASNKFGSVTIVGEEGSSLTGCGKGIGIQGRYGVPITIENANMTLSSNGTAATAAPLYTENANITVKNSTLNIITTKGAVNAIHAEGTGAINAVNSELELTATGTAFNKAPVLSEGWVGVAGDAAESATAVTDAAVLANAKYAKVSYPAPEPTAPTYPTVGVEGSLSFKLNTDGSSYSVSDCDDAVSGALSIPNAFYGLPVTGIVYPAFTDCTGLTDVTIPDSVTSIGSSAFYHCTGLTDVTIPDSVTGIGSYAFAYCYGLANVYYAGTQAQWDAITVNTGNTYLLNAALHLESDGTLPTVAPTYPTATVPTAAPTTVTSVPTATMVPTVAPTTVPTTAPTEQTTAPTTAVTSGTVTLWGLGVTVDTDETTTEIPEAYYWINGEEGLAPVPATAADNWNYRFSIIDGVPTVTVKNASYAYAATFLKATYDGVLKFVYEGENNIVVPYLASSGYGFINYSSATNSSGKGHLYIVGAENAKLDVTGGSKGVSLLGVTRKAYLTIVGGTISMERTNAGGVTPVIGAAYSKTVIEDCTLNVKSVDAVPGKHPAVILGYNNAYGATINNANVSIETNAHTGLCLGVFQSNMEGVLYSAPLTIQGNSVVKVVTNSNSVSDYAYNGVGIWARDITVNGGTLEVEASVKALHITTGNAPVLSEGWVGVAGDAAESATAVTDAAVLANAKYAKVTCFTETAELRVMGYTDLVASTDGKCTYLINVPETCVDAEGATFSGTSWKVIARDTTSEPADWNVKYAFPAGGTPTLTLRGAVLDWYNESTGQYSTHNSATYHNAITGKTYEKTHKLNIVIAEDSYIATNGFVVANSDYYGDVTITSIGSAKLTTHSAKGIASNSNLHLNGAYLSMEVPKFYGAMSGALYAKGGITINGGNYELSSSTAGGSGLWDGPVGQLIRANGGDIVINGGTFDLYTGLYATSSGIGAIHNASADHRIIINDGSFYIDHRNISAFWGKNPTLINGGNIYATGSWYSLGKDGYVKMTGGTLELWRSSGGAYYSASHIDLSEYENWAGVWGVAKETATAFTNLDGVQRYIKIYQGSGSSTTPTEAPTMVPTVTPTYPTATVPTTVPTVAPTTVPTVAPTEPVDSRLSFALNADGESYYVSGCDEAAEGGVTIPSTYNGKPVTAIGDYAFSWCENMTSVTIPDSVTAIGDFAFECCYSLTGIWVDEGNPNYSSDSFGVLFDKKTLIQAPGAIADGYTIPDGVITIGDWAFSACSEIYSIRIPDGVTTIGEGAFSTCENLTYVTIPDSVTTIGKGAFAYCLSLASVNIPASVTSIGDAFSDCWSLNGIWVDENNPNYSSDSFGVLFNKDKTVLMQAPGGAFSGEYAIPDGVTTIENSAFYNCWELYSITIPASVTSIGDYAFDSDVCSLEDVYYLGTQEQWDAIDIGYHENWQKDNIQFVHTHTYEAEVVPPTYFEEGYTIYTCTVCGDTYEDDYVAPLDRIDLSNATLTLEYTSAFYEGVALTPGVTLTYQGETYDPAQELRITYANNDRVGTATVTAEGIRKFTGTVTLSFTIVYEVIPAQIVNVVAIGEIGKVSLSWGESSEVNTDSYRIYRKAEGESEYQLIKTVNGRTTLSYEDKSVEKTKTYSYYVTGVGLYGAESEPSLVATATVQVDKTAPTVLKLSPAAASVITGKTTLSATATDNIGVTRVAYFYTLDNGETWVSIGETANKAFSIVFDTGALDAETVKVKAIAYDAEGNESDPVTVVYSLDNEGPDKVTGLSAVTLSSKITLSWSDVAANDAAYFILQSKSGEEWKTVANRIKTLGYTVTGLQPDTDYIYRVACVDTHGNVGEYSDAFTARTAVDVTAPVITSQRPNSARYNSAIQFSATAKDDCNIETIEIQVSTDLRSWTTVSANTYTAKAYTQTYTYTIDLSTYAEGSLFVRAVATDFSGNVSDTSDAAPYTEYMVDKTAPEAPAGVAANGNDGYITVSWEMGAEADLGKYFVYRSTSMDGNYQLIASNLSSLNYHDRDVQSGNAFYYKVKVSDACGNMSAYSNGVWATMSPDTQNPEITSISTTYQQRISSGMHTINVAATDNNKLSRIVVEYCTSRNGAYTQLAFAENIDNHYKSISVVLPIDGLTDGDVVYLRAYAVDMAGLQSEQATAQYTLDTTAPAVRDYTASADGATVSLTWKDSGESDLSGFKVYRSADGTSFTLLGSRGVNGTGAYSFVDTITAKESATYIYKLEAIDRLGNTAFWTNSVDYTYVYVNQKPVAGMNIPDFMTVGVEERFDASGSTDDIEIMYYLWDFGDGTMSTAIKPVKCYDAVGTYTVKLTVTDNEGVTATVTKDIEVKERDFLGTLNVKVVDEKGKALSYVPVYFDLGGQNQKILYTNASGIATLQMLSGSHTIGMYASGYLPVKKDVVVLANATRTVTLTTVEEDIVTGHFEVTRMTFDEIVAAGIDVYDPANQNVYSATVRVTYGSTAPITISYVRNDDRIINYTIKDTNGKPVTHYTNSNGEVRKITGVTYIPSGGSGSGGASDVVAIVDIPASASYLKEFFDVRLHIINNASSEFVLEKNEVVLNVPEGMTLMSSVTGAYSPTNTVLIDAIRGQQTVTLAWVLRGDKAGEYDLSADFTGTLAEFNELVTARFETEEPIKVYGLEGVKFRILAADEIHNDTLYFNVELENERDIDIYMPAIGFTEKVKNVTDSVLNGKSEGDFLAQAYILNAYLQTNGGAKQYLPIRYDANGKPTTNVEVLAPGQKLVYEYVAYNAINYDGVAYFQEAAITEFEGILENIETGSFHKELYSFTDYSEKLDAVISGTDSDVAAGFDYIRTDSNYYYEYEADEHGDSVLEGLYESLSMVLEGDFSGLTQDEERDLIERVILTVLADESMAKVLEERVTNKYIEAITSMIDAVELGVIDKFEREDFSAEDIAKAFDGVLEDVQELTVTYRKKGMEAFGKELSEKLVQKGLSFMADQYVMDLVGEDIEAFSDLWDDQKELLTGFFEGIEKTQREAAYYAILRNQCSAEVAEMVLDAIIQSTEQDLHTMIEGKDLAELAVETMLASFSPALWIILQDKGLDEQTLIYQTAKRMKKDLEKNRNEFWEGLRNCVDSIGQAAAGIAIQSVMEAMIGATPLAWVSVGFSVIDTIFSWGDHIKQQNTMTVYAALSDAFYESFNRNIQTRGVKEDAYSMLYLKTLCQIRLKGEAQYKSFINDYVIGRFLSTVDEQEAVERINKVMNTSYTTIDGWWDAVQFNIIRSRDHIFNEEGVTPVERPGAPVVTLDYESLQTVEVFTAEYEYCFADGAWKTCGDEPITFTVGVTPSVLRVRKAASDTNFAGEITTVKIFARKDLSKLITAKFDGVNYLLDNLSSQRNYQVVFTNDADAAVNWANALTISGNDSTVTVSGVGEYTYLIIRSCENAELQETTSNPLLLTVSKKKPLNLVIDGSGTVKQTSDLGCYFNGEDIELIATANTGCEFSGWYIDGACVSTDACYIVEMADGLMIVARFTGVKITGVTIEQLPAKRRYYVGEPLDLSGLKLLVTYSDGTTAYADQFAAQLSSNTVGTATVVITYGGYAASYEITIREKIGEHDHEYETTVVTAATCTKTGTQIKTRILCDYSYTETVDALGHTEEIIPG